jgi:hypothetical protein
VGGQDSIRFDDDYKRALGGQEASYHQCVKDYLIKCKMSTDFQVIEGLETKRYIRLMEVGQKKRIKLSLPCLKNLKLLVILRN